MDDHFNNTQKSYLSGQIVLSEMKIPILTNKKILSRGALALDNKFSKPNPRINIIIIVIYLLFAIFLALFVRTSRAVVVQLFVGASATLNVSGFVL